MGGAISGKVVVGCLRKQAEQAGSKPVMSISRGLCFSSCLQVSALSFLLDFPHEYIVTRECKPK